ncbi:hypothetical protein [Sulfuracidifex tepidarius]|uniref:Uncharacterized protein n=1 Tax=Sulfuracidifex tepidarius TaxID=1294262 RepID=A0A510E0D5_9CREN|nr:hypothetical protein [Sulfuracidifex tepidarius]BBG25955.1 hypothetical protein IC007_0460 [Sulfuracidifex tepidarius]
MIAKVYSCLGPILIKIAEERCENIPKVVEEWKYACLIEILSDDQSDVLYTFKYPEEL